MKHYVFLNEEITDEKFCDLIENWYRKEFASTFRFIPEEYMILIGCAVANKLNNPLRIYGIDVRTSSTIFQNSVIFGKINELPYSSHPLPPENYMNPRFDVDFCIERIQQPLNPTPPDFLKKRFNTVANSLKRLNINYRPFPDPDRIQPKKVIFNDPATIVYWPDRSKTIVKAEGEDFDPEKGLAMAIAKKYLGNKGNYYDVFRKWLPKVKKVESNPANSNVGKCVNCKHWKCPLIFEPCLSCNRTGGKLNYEER